MQEILAVGRDRLEISNRNARARVAGSVVDAPRRVAKLIAERGADMAEAPGGSTDLLVRQYQGAPAMPVYRVDTGLVALLAPLRAHEKQAAEELGQWSEKREPEVDGAPAPTAVTVTSVRPGEELAAVPR